MEAETNETLSDYTSPAWPSVLIQPPADSKGLPKSLTRLRYRGRIVHSVCATAEIWVRAEPSTIATIIAAMDEHRWPRLRRGRPAKPESWAHAALESRTRKGEHTCVIEITAYRRTAYGCVRLAWLEPPTSDHAVLLQLRLHAGTDRPPLLYALLHPLQITLAQRLPAIHKPPVARNDVGRDGLAMERPGAVFIDPTSGAGAVPSPRDFHALRQEPMPVPRLSARRGTAVGALGCALPYVIVYFIAPVLAVAAGHTGIAMAAVMFTAALVSALVTVGIGARLRRNAERSNFAYYLQHTHRYLRPVMTAAQARHIVEVAFDTLGVRLRRVGVTANDYPIIDGRIGVHQLITVAVVIVPLDPGGIVHGVALQRFADAGFDAPMPLQIGVHAASDWLSTGRTAKRLARELETAAAGLASPPLSNSDELDHRA